MSAPKDLPITPAFTDRAIAALRQAVDGKAPLDPKSRRLHAALDYLAMAMAEAWGVEQFRAGLRFANETARWQNCNASLAAIERSRSTRDAFCSDR